VEDFVLSVALSVLAVSFVGWLVLSITIVVNRLWYDAHHRQSSGTLTRRKARELVRRARSESRTEWGRSRKVVALARLANAKHPAAPRLLRRALDDADPAVAAAAVRGLGALGGEWAIEQLIEALRRGRVSRSRVASQLERLAPMPGAHLLELVSDDDPAARFWGATLLARYSGIGEASLIALTRDDDANVRAAAAETLGERGEDSAAPALLALLDDPAWFVRVHAARSTGHVVGAAGAPAIARLLADTRWWVRTAAKDALRSLGRAALPALVPVLSSEDRFARNGAAEVLQDIGVVDQLAVQEPHGALLARIYAAGGQRMREAAEMRAGRAEVEREAA
jgi:HEAT repeat protein